MKRYLEFYWRFSEIPPDFDSLQRRMPQQVRVVEPVIGIRLVLTSSLQIESSIPLKAQSVVLEESLITLYKAICSYSAGKSPGHASQCHEVIQAQCLDDGT